MDYILLGIALASLATNLFLVRHFTKGRVLLTATTEEFINLPFPGSVEWQQAADEWSDEVVTTDPEPAPAAVKATDSSPWKNQVGIQQGVSATPAPPIVKPQVAPLARPGGFV